ncbi:hypothetical protein H0H92_013892 [Tricholoma furcatifolium]|nr:hypothetical protein H0H92_013892 [Tricholoma furcatifolium]
MTTARGSSPNLWESINEPTSSGGEDDVGSEDEVDELRSTRSASVSLKRKSRLPSSLARASPKRQRTEEHSDGKPVNRSSIISTWLTISPGSSPTDSPFQTNGANGVIPPSSAAKSTDLRISEIGQSSKLTAAASTSTSTVFPSIRKPVISTPSKLRKLKAGEGLKTKGVGASGAAEIIEIDSDNGDDPAPQTRRSTARKSTGRFPPSTVQIKSRPKTKGPPPKGAMVIEVLDSSDEENPSPPKLSPQLKLSTEGSSHRTTPGHKAISSSQLSEGPTKAPSTLPIPSSIPPTELPGQNGTTTKVDSAESGAFKVQRGKVLGWTPGPDEIHVDMEDIHQPSTSHSSADDPNFTATASKKLPFIDFRKRDQFISTSSNASKDGSKGLGTPSTKLPHLRKSSDLDMSVLKDALASPASISPPLNAQPKKSLESTKPILPNSKSSSSRDIFREPETGMSSPIKPKEASLSSDSSKQQDVHSVKHSKAAVSDYVDLTLDSDDEILPLPSPPTPVAAPRPLSPRVPSNPKSTPRTASLPAKDDTILRPPPAPLPSPAPRSEAEHQKPKDLICPLPTSVVEDRGPASSSPQLLEAATPLVRKDIAVRPAPIPLPPPTPRSSMPQESKDIIPTSQSTSTKIEGSESSVIPTRPAPIPLPPPTPRPIPEPQETKDVLTSSQSPSVQMEASKSSIIPTRPTPLPLPLPTPRSLPVSEERKDLLPSSQSSSVQMEASGPSVIPTRPTPLPLPLPTPRSLPVSEEPKGVLPSSQSSSLQMEASEPSVIPTRPPPLPLPLPTPRSVPVSEETKAVLPSSQTSGVHIEDSGSSMIPTRPTSMPLPIPRSVTVPPEPKNIVTSQAPLVPQAKPSPLPPLRSSAPSLNRKGKLPSASGLAIVTSSGRLSSPKSSEVADSTRFESMDESADMGGGDSHMSVDEESSPTSSVSSSSGAPATVMLYGRTARKSTRGRVTLPGLPIYRSRAPHSGDASESSSSSSGSSEAPSSPRLTALSSAPKLRRPIKSAAHHDAMASKAAKESDLEDADALSIPQRSPSLPLNEVEMMDVEELLKSDDVNPTPPMSEDEQESADVTLGLGLVGKADSVFLSQRSTRASRANSEEDSDAFPFDLGSDGSSRPSTSPTPANKSVRATRKVFGGFHSLNWHSYIQDPKNIQPKHYLSKDLPHMLQDTINSFTDLGKSYGTLAPIMEANIRENTADDEPDAPLIRLINEVDDDPTPPWEFHYSNKMWLGDGVPPPDVTNLVHCDCVGRCDPKSRTCACAQRQHASVADVYPTPDFLYDNRGRVKTTDYPIFECNDLCGCGDECRNRVVQQGRKCAVNIQKTKNKGWGVFADDKKIYSGTFIGIYAGELLTDAVGDERGIIYNKFGTTYLFNLDFWHLRAGKDEDWDIKYVVDAYHAGNFTRFLVSFVAHAAYIA